MIRKIVLVGLTLFVFAVVVAGQVADYRRMSIEGWSVTACSRGDAAATDSVLVNATAVETSGVFAIGGYGYFSVQYKAFSSGAAPDVDIKYQLSNFTAFGWYAVADSLVADGLTGEIWFGKAISPASATSLRFIIIGNAGNAADTYVWTYLMKGI